MNVAILNELIIIFTLSLFVILISNKIKVPPIVGFLITGLLAGPHGFGLVHSETEIEILAEIGIILLLFTIGVEFSLTRLLEIKKLVFIGGLTQVGLTFAASYFISYFFGLPSNQAIVAGLLVCLSSTALVLKLLQEKAMIDSVHGRTAFSILLFQDIAIVPAMLFLPYLSLTADASEQSLLFILGKGFLILAITMLAASWLIPKLFEAIAKTGQKEIFLMSVLLICFSVAFLTYKAGLSLALGALLAGLIISETDYSHDAFSNILPFQQIFTTVFFISVGMLLDLSFTYNHLGIVILGTLLVIVLKTLLAIPSSILLGYPIKSAVLTALTIAQIGEFAFVLAKSALKYDLITNTNYQIFLNISIFTMALTPLIISLAPKVASAVARLPLPKTILHGFEGIDESRHLLSHDKLKDHALVIGFGISGKLVARSLENSKISYAVLDLNPETIKKQRAKGIPIVYGDATQEAVLLEEGIKDARLLVIVISDYIATRQIAALARKLNPNLYVIARTRMVKEIQSLYDLGVNEVIPEEFEVGVEVFSRVLKNYLVPVAEITDFIKQVRSNSYAMASSPNFHQKIDNLRAQFPELSISTHRVNEGSNLAGKTLVELAFRSKYGITLLAIKRGEEINANPSADTSIAAHDLLIFMGDCGCLL